MYQQSTEALQQQSDQLLTAANSQQEQIMNLVESLQTQFQMYLPYALGLSGLIILFMLVNMIQKLRAERAIMRIDKNLKKLVELQTMSGVAETAKESADKLADDHDDSHDEQEEKSDENH